MSMKTYRHFLEDCNKSVTKYISEDVNISGNASVGTIVISSNDQPSEFGENFVADILYQGNLHRLKLISKDTIPTREELGEHLQDEYPGSIVQAIYTVNVSNNPYRVKDSKRYHPSKLDWI